ncbi:hypothetical protein GGR57DRAFT_476850 [Xylariaceae sp. FL1272]|nr:hypothetical protein GGR57DRAFT_476850 [Xylariaceae sp. FL1272]
MMRGLLVELYTAAFAVVGAAAASVTCRGQLPAIKLPVTTVASLTAVPSFLERAIRRPNGDLIATQLETGAQLWILKDSSTSAARLAPLHNFSESNGLLGIASVAPDTYIVTAQLFSGFLDPVPNTTVIWEIQFEGTESDAFSLRKAGDFPSAGLFNGMATMPEEPTIALIGDSFNGQVVRLDVVTGTHDVLLDIPELHASEGAAFPVGINGLQIHKGYLYWSNTARVAFYRIAIDSNGRLPSAAQVEALASIPSISGVDDFVFDARDNLWGLANLDNQAFVLYKGSDSRREYQTVQFVAGGLNSSEIPGPTAYAWGARNEGHLLYVTTSGGSKAPINGTYVEPAKVAAIDTTAFFKR